MGRIVFGDKLKVPQTLQNKAIEWLAKNASDLEFMHDAEIRNQLTDSLFTEMMEVWILGVDTGANLNRSYQDEQQERVSEKVSA